MEGSVASSLVNLKNSANIWENRLQNKVAMKKMKLINLLMLILMLVLLSEPLMISFLKTAVITDWENQTNLSLLWSQNLNCYTNVIDNLQVLNGVSVDNSRTDNFNFEGTGGFKWVDSGYEKFLGFYGVILDQNLKESIENLTMLENGAKNLNLLSHFSLYS
jgi:hypothetical protein